MCLVQFFLVMGLPAVITTDQGREFHNKVNAHLMDVFGVKHRMTTPYHPQANGLDERYNQTLVNAVAKFSQENRATWDEKLAEIVYAYNTSVHESTKHTPFEVMFGRKARLPIDFNVDDQYSPEEKMAHYEGAEEPLEVEMEADRQAMEEAVKVNIAKAQVKLNHLY